MSRDNRLAQPQTGRPVAIVAPQPTDGVARALRRAYHPCETLPREWTALLSRLN